MNKKLIALAIAAAVSAPAMAATSNVEIYGLMNIGVDSVTNGSGVAGNHDTTRAGRVTDYVSRIGFKGAEDLGNGLSAVWQIENQISTDGTDGNGGGGAFGGQGLRNTFVGLKSKDMGEVRLGRHDTPYKMATGSLDQFADTMADYNGVVGAANGRGASSYFDQRLSNVVAYITPTFSGFTAAGAYVFGAETATTGTPTTGNAYSLAGMYSAGPLYLTAAYEKHNFGSTGSGSLAGTANADEKAWKLGASYSIMDFTLAAMYEKTDDSLGTSGVNKYGHRTWFLSGKYQMGAIALKAQYANAGSDDQSTVDDGAKQYSLGADYAFSKRTTVYALYTKISNDTNGAYNFKEGAATGLVAGDAISGVTLGIKHSF